MTSRGLMLSKTFISQNALMNNGIGRYVPQLARVTIKFCKEHGSSQGVRRYIEEEIVDFARKNPATVVYLKPRRHRSPVLVAEFLNGQTYYQSLHMLGSDTVSGFMEIYRGHSGVVYSEQGKYTYSDHPSIQGYWNPTTNKEPASALYKFPRHTSLPQEPTATEMLQQLFNSQQNSDGGAEHFSQGEKDRLETRKQGES
eukprot:TRINITY_DN4221_c0_g1_i4.p1 TRINITY_DN4221_c0_g1~~TRINITY_DN4221_c0_g1_i4.p1  ORF type:complete len:199 (-),score=24.83 TRINITY_DN4221_c0_g1_i4:59-655(-)